MYIICVCMYKLTHVTYSYVYTSTRPHVHTHTCNVYYSEGGDGNNACGGNGGCARVHGGLLSVS